MTLPLNKYIEIISLFKPLIPRITWFLIINSEIVQKVCEGVDIFVK